MEHDQGLASADLTGRGVEAARVVEGLDVQADHLDLGVARQVAEQLGVLDVDLLAQGHDVPQAQVVICRRVEQGLRDRARLGDQRDRARRGDLAEEAGREQVLALEPGEEAGAVGADHAGAGVARDRHQLLLEPAPLLAELGGARGEHSSTECIHAASRRRLQLLCILQEVAWVGNKLNTTMIRHMHD